MSLRARLAALQKQRPVDAESRLLLLTFAAPGAPGDDWDKPAAEVWFGGEAHAVEPGESAQQAANRLCETPPPAHPNVRVASLRPLRALS